MFMCTDKWMDGQPNRLAEKSMDRFIDSLKDLYSVTFQPKSKIKLFREMLPANIPLGTIFIVTTNANLYQ